MLKREVPLVGPVAVNRSFVSFVHMSVTVQGLLIAATGLGFLLADIGRGDASERVFEQDWLLMVPALLAALYLMLSEKILRDRAVLQKIRDAVHRARAAESPKTVTLAEHFLKARTIYHFLMLSCFLFYAAARFTVPGEASHHFVFFLECGLVLVFFCEFLLSAAGLRATYGGLIVDDLARLEQFAPDGEASKGLIRLVRRHLDTPAGAGVRVRVSVLWFVRTLAAAVATACLVAPALGFTVPVGPHSARWIADGCIIALGLTFSWFNMRREQFLELATVLCERISRLTPQRGDSDR